MDLQPLRDVEFPVTRHWAFFDHAAVAPPTARAARALNEWMTDLSENGVVHESHWLDEVEEVRHDFGLLLNADPLDIAFVKNTSEGIGFVAEGLDWKSGDNVITAEEEYPSNLYPWMNLSSRGVEVRRVASRGPRIGIDDVKAVVDSRTRLITLSWVEFASGFRNDLDAIGSFCRQHGILFFVDAIQGLGVLPLDVQKTPVDFLSADGHKWLLGPEGAGVFWIRRELVEQLRPISVGWNSVVGAFDFSRIELNLKPHAGRWENGTLNIGGICALGASLDLLLEIGVVAIQNRIDAVTGYLCDRVQSAGWEVFSSRDPREVSGIVSLTAPGVNIREVVRRGREAGVAVSRRAERLRVSPHFYNTEDEIDRLVELLREARSGTPSA